MTPHELCERLGGVKSLNRMKARVDGKLEIIARLNGHTYEFTDVGAAQAAKFNAEQVVGLGAPEKEEKPRRRTRTTQPKLADDGLDS